jgi:uncharacterized membrane protein YdjX (TVP38/TMEM64 family)
MGAVLRAPVTKPPGNMLLQRPGPDATRRLRRMLVRLAPLACLLGLLVVAYALGWHRTLSLQTLVENNAAIDAFIAAHRIAAILCFVVIYAIGAILAMPVGAVLAVVGGFLFGALIGGAAAMIGSTLGATAVFLIARSAFGEVLLRRLGPRVESFAAGFRADAFYYVMFLRLMPVPSWFTNLTAALFAVRLRTFMGATAIGRIPGSFLLALFGAGLDSMIATQEVAYRACLASGELDCRIDFDPANVVTPTLIAALAGLGLLALVPVLAKRLLMRRAAVE